MPSAPDAQKAKYDAGIHEAQQNLKDTGFHSNASSENNAAAIVSALAAEPDVAVVASVEKDLMIDSVPATGTTARAKAEEYQRVAKAAGLDPVVLVQQALDLRKAAKKV